MPMEGPNWVNVRVEGRPDRRRLGVFGFSADVQADRNLVEVGDDLSRFAGRAWRLGGVAVR